MKHLSSPSPLLILAVSLLAVALIGCTPHSTSTTSAPLAATLQPTLTPTGTLQPTPTETLVPTATPDTRLEPEDWQEWPVIPELESYAYEVYSLGQELGRDAHVFSVIGDCKSSPTYFLSLYDEDRYTLPEGEEYLEDTIDWYAGSFVHRSITVKNGMTAASALNPYWSDPDLCETTETPVA